MNRQWKFLIIDEGYQIYGTDDLKVANEAAINDVVIDVSTCQELGHNADPSNIIRRDIPEQNWFDLSNSN